MSAVTAIYHIVINTHSRELTLPLADCPQNLDIFGMITRKDVDTGDISLMRCLPWDISIGTQKRESPRAK